MQLSMRSMLWAAGALRAGRAMIGEEALHVVAALGGTKSYRDRPLAPAPPNEVTCSASLSQWAFMYAHAASRDAGLVRSAR